MHPHWFNALIVLVAILAGSAEAQTVYVNDTFEDGLSNDGTNTLDLLWAPAGSPTQDRLTLTTAVYNSGASNSSTNASTAMYANNTRPEGGSGNFVLILGKSFNGGAQALAIGETITLKMDLRVPVTPISSSAAAFRLGLGTNSNTYTANFGSGTTLSGSIQRYGVDLASGTSTALTTSTTTAAINDNETHQFKLEITRTDTSTMALKGTIDSTVITGLLASTSDFTFNRIVLGQGGVPNLDMHIDNVQVFTSVPEPASLALLACGWAVLMRRRSRQ